MLLIKFMGDQVKVKHSYVNALNKNNRRYKIAMYFKAVQIIQKCLFQGSRYSLRESKYLFPAYKYFSKIRGLNISLRYLDSGRTNYAWGPVF